MLLTPQLIAQLNAEEKVFGDAPPQPEASTDKKKQRKKKKRPEEKPPEHFALSAFQLSPEPENLPMPSLAKR